jgi:hypothetical protein
VRSTLPGIDQLDEHPEPHRAEAEALEACESRHEKPNGDDGSTRAAACPTAVNHGLGLVAHADRLGNNLRLNTYVLLHDPV